MRTISLHVNDQTSSAAKDNTIIVECESGQLLANRESCVTIESLYSQLNAATWCAMAKNEFSTAADRSRARKFGVGMSHTSIRSIKQQNDAQSVQWNKDVLYLTSSPCKGFYTWLSSPQTVHPTRKKDKTVAVIAPTPHIL